MVVPRAQITHDNRTEERWAYKYPNTPPNHNAGKGVRFGCCAGKRGNGLRIEIRSRGMTTDGSERKLGSYSRITSKTIRTSGGSNVWVHIVVVTIAG